MYLIHNLNCLTFFCLNRTHIITILTFLEEWQCSALHGTTFIFIIQFKKHVTNKFLYDISIEAKTALALFIIEMRIQDIEKQNRYCIYNFSYRHLYIPDTLPILFFLSLNVICNYQLWMACKISDVCYHLSFPFWIYNRSESTTLFLCPSLPKVIKNLHRTESTSFICCNPRHSYTTSRPYSTICASLNGVFRFWHRQLNSKRKC